MKRARTLAAILLAAALLAPLSGCASVFDKQYFSSEPYEDLNDSQLSTDGATSVRNYSALRLAVSQLVTEHRDEATFDFRSYAGDVSGDVAAACRAASVDTALGSYCVDYITYDLDRIVAYYEATVYINYKRTPEEVAAIVAVDDAGGLYTSLVQALSDGAESLVALVAATGFGENDALDYAVRAYHNNPLCSVTAPDFDVTVYSGDGLQKIFEYRIRYGSQTDGRVERLRQTVTNMADSISAQGESYRALQAASLLIEVCAADEKGGGTVWAALIEGDASSEGMAMAYQALCAQAGVSCEVVSGRFDKVTHYWNIIAVGDEHYHVDVSRARAVGFAQSFLCSDADMWGQYWWDTEDYPVCEGGLDYQSVATA